jgi:ribosomal-protein-alanine N-acetyltransferase
VPLPTLDLGLPGWTLRAWRESDATALTQHANNPNVWRWMSDAFPHPYTREIAETWVARGHIDFGGDNWAIAFGDEAVGGCGIAPLAGPQRCVAEVGWWLRRPRPLWRLVAPIHAGNQRSMRVAEKAGFLLEAVQRQSTVKAGRVIDRHLFVRLRGP